MAVVLPNGRNQFDGVAGGPGVGYKLYTYVAGTSTPKDTYTTSVGNVANTNPVVMDARGEAAIYWVGSYDVTLKTAADVTVWGPERLVVFGDELADTSDAAKGDALIGVKLVATGATARTQHSKNADFVTPEDFGCVGDGTTDDTANFQAALDSTVPVLYVGKTYKVTGLTMTAAMIVLGPGTIKRTAVGTTPLLAIKASNVTIDGLAFLGASVDAKPATQDAGDQGVVAQFVSLTSVTPITNVSILNTTVNGFRGAGIQVAYSLNARVNRNTVKYCGYAGIYLGSAVDFQVLGNRVSYIDATALPLVNAYGITMTRDSSSTTTISARCTNGVVNDSIVHDVPAWTGIDMHAAKNIVVSSNRVYFCKNGITAQYDDSNVGNPNRQPSEDITIGDNIVEGNADITTVQIGIASLGLPSLPNQRVTIHDNVLIGCGNYTSATGAVYIDSTNWGIARGNTIEKSIRQAMCLSGTSKYCELVGNKINGVIDGASGSSYMNFVVANLTGCSVRDNVIANTTGSASYTSTIGMLYDAANTGLVFSRNRINDLTGVQYTLKVAGSANNYPELGWELETETIKFDFTTAGAGGLAPYEQIADKSGSFRRLPWRGTNEIVRENIYIAEKSGSAPPLYFITNPLKVYTPWVYRADAVNTAAGVVLTGITYSISGVYWTQ